MINLPDSHNEYVAQISDQLKICYKNKTKVRIYHGSSNSTRVTDYKKGGVVDVSKLNRILSINKAERFALVEPSVPMDALVKETLKYGLIPAVVMEFPGITVGGGVQGGRESLVPLSTAGYMTAVMSTK